MKQWNWHKIKLMNLKTTIKSGQKAEKRLILNCHTDDTTVLSRKYPAKSVKRLFFPHFSRVAQDLVISRTSLRGLLLLSRHRPQLPKNVKILSDLLLPKYIHRPGLNVEFHMRGKSNNSIPCTWNATSKSIRWDSNELNAGSVAFD